jgi:hypothetical protein
MSKVYINQSKLTLKCDTKIQLKGVTSSVIKYKKPSGTTGQFTATIDGTKLVYIVQNNDLNEAGDWIFWSYVTFQDGKSAPGEPFTLTVFEEGN